MSKGSLMGMLLFAVIVVIRICANDRIPDDPTTIALKQAGIYYYVIGGGCLFIIAGLTFCVINHFKIEKLKKQADALRALRAHLLVNPQIKNISGKRWCPECGRFH